MLDGRSNAWGREKCCPGRLQREGVGSEGVKEAPRAPSWGPLFGTMEVLDRAGVSGTLHLGLIGKQRALEAKVILIRFVSPAARNPEPWT